MVLITDDDTVMTVRMITMQTIRRIKVMRMEIFPLLCRIFFYAQILKSKHGCWCHLVPYGMLRDQSRFKHKLSHGIYFVIST